MSRVRVSRWINRHLLRGDEKEMVSARAYREGWFKTETCLDKLFFWHDRHCRNCYLFELKEKEDDI